MRENIDPIVEITSEVAGSNALREICIGRADQPRLEWHRAFAAEAMEGTAFDNPQELGLELGRQLGDLIEEK